MGANETFFTVIGCMDGRCQKPLMEFGQQYFNATYPDTITDAGIVGIIAQNPSQDFLDGLKTKVLISLEKHHSKGIIIDGHAECAGDPVDDATHKEHIRKSLHIVKSMVPVDTKIVGVFVIRDPQDPTTWVVGTV